MNGITHYETFLLAGVLLNLTPGNDTLYILSQSIAHGRRAGIYSALGIGTGTIVHTLFAAFGLSLIIARSLVLFSVVKYLGAGYLVYLGIVMMRSRTTITDRNITTGSVGGHWRTYRDAVLTNVLNPKVALFFIAFLPQFVDASYRAAVLPFLVLGLTFTCTGTLWCLVLASFAAGVSHRLKAHERTSRILNNISGAVLIGLGLKLALTQAK